MMRPMKLAGSELMFGQGCLEHLKALKGNRAIIIMSGDVLEKTGILNKVKAWLNEAKVETEVFSDVEPEPSFATVLKGTEKMKSFSPDWIIALGGGSPMDAAKAMWIYYEHPELTKLSDIEAPNEFPKLRNKARLVCIPSTSGTASEVSRSIVITDEKTGTKHGIGNMEMMPDIAICDPEVTASMPPKITAETGLDALTHAVEAYVSNRANYISDILAVQAVKDIFEYLPKAFDEGTNMEYREKMLNASLIAGLAFTNVSLGIVHSMAHTVGGYFKIPHGLADAVILPYVIKFNSANKNANQRYSQLAKLVGADNFSQAVANLKARLNIPKGFNALIDDEEKYNSMIDEMAQVAAKDGCTKTNPLIPSHEDFVELFKEVYIG